MQQTPSPASPVTAAVLCIDAPADPTANPMCLRRLMGQPILVHQIMQLRRHGITNFAIAVESVPAELHIIVERLVLQGIEAQIVRHGSALKLTPSERVLVRKSDFWIDDVLLEAFLKQDGNRIAVVDEGPAHTAFERIDLNRRWPGLALLESDLIQSDADMPDDWNMASTLLRKCLQRHIPEFLVASDLVNGGKLKPLTGLESEDAWLRIWAPKSASDDEWARKLAEVADRFCSQILGNAHLAKIVPFTPVSLAAFSIVLAYFGQATFALTSALLAFLTMRLYGRILAWRYQQSNFVTPDFLTLTMFPAVIALILMPQGIGVWNSAYHGLTLAGLLAVETKITIGTKKRAVVPEIAIVALAASYFWHLVLPVVQLLILLIVARLLLTEFIRWKNSHG